MILLKRKLTARQCVRQSERGNKQKAVGAIPPQCFSLPPCSKPSRRGLEILSMRKGRATADLDSLCARRRMVLAVGAKESLRRGRTKESGAREDACIRGCD